MRNQLSELCTIAHALSDPNRVRLLAACMDQERCVCQLVGLIELSNPAISKHLSTLKDAGLLESRREGRWVHYRTPDSPTAIAAGAMLSLREAIENDPQIRSDELTLSRIDAIDPSELARMQRLGCCVPLNEVPANESPALEGSQS